MFRKYSSRSLFAGGPGFLLLVSATLIFLLVSAESAVAQCAMCREALANSSEASVAAEHFNLAILVLLIPPVLMFAGLFGMIYRSARSKEDDQPIL